MELGAAMLQKLLNRLKTPDTDAEPARLVALAAAALLLEVSWADHDISDAELAHIGEALQSTFGLAEADTAELLAQSRRDHEESVGVFGYTRAINESWEEPAKFDLLVALWRLALSDDDLNRREEQVIRKIADLLYLSHARFIEAKLRAKRSD
jgi:uncharacterized tellurite resistance protein B-like protein